MKYLKEDMTVAEAKAAYRRLAKTLHPDAGGDEQEFKILSDEYVSIVRLFSKPPAVSFDDFMRVVDARVSTIIETIRELYPRTLVTLYYTPAEVILSFHNTPLRKMLEIERIVKEFKFNMRTTIQFEREGSKKKYTVFTEGPQVYINIGKKETPILEGAKRTYDGRRYKIDTNRVYERCTDTKTGTVYTMRRTPKFRLKELMGL